jgi:hypothetical protein
MRGDISIGDKKEASSSALATDKENFAGDKYPSASFDIKIVVFPPLVNSIC